MNLFKRKNSMTSPNAYIERRWKRIIERGDLIIVRTAFEIAGQKSLNREQTAILLADMAINMTEVLLKMKTPRE